MGVLLIDLLGAAHAAVLRHVALHPEGFRPSREISGYVCDALADLGALSRYGRDHFKITRVGRVGLGLGETECSICRRSHGIEVIHACE
jgi:hypothetical protein